MTGLNHFTKSKMMVAYAQSKNVPAPKLAVFVSGALLLLGGLSLLLGFYPQVGVWLVVAFFLGVTFKMHDFWNVPEEEKMAQMVNFMKNLALLGSTLMFLAIEMPWAFSL